jgi:cytochrome c oxidase assembly factor CtaG
MRPLTFAELPWSWSPWIVASLAVACLLYARGLARIEGAIRAQLFGPLRRASFVAGIAILFVVLISPFDALDDQLFSAHMAQHLVLMMVAPPLLLYGRTGLVLMMVAPPLLLYGRTGLVFLWAMPLNARRAIRRILRLSGLRQTMHAAMSPPVVWLLCTTFLCFWHIPAPYGWALDSEIVHAAEHVCFFVPSLMLEPQGRRRLPYVTAMLLVLTFAVQNGLMGAILTFSARPFYSSYFTTTAAWGLTPLEDQQLGGLGMWIPASLIHLTTLSVLFVAWMRESERREFGQTPRSRATT